MAKELQQVPTDETEQRALSRRVSEALRPPGGENAEQPSQPEYELDAALTWSDKELLREMDFEQMSAEEIAKAKAAKAAANGITRSIMVPPGYLFGIPQIKRIAASVRI